MRRACVRADIDEAVERAAAAVGLHRFEHVRVFQKRGFRALVKQLGHFAVADRKVAGKAEQVVTRRFGLGRDQMARLDRYAPAAVAGGSAGSRPGAAGLELPAEAATT